MNYPNNIINELITSLESFKNNKPRIIRLKIFFDEIMTCLIEQKIPFPIIAGKEEKGEYLSFNVLTAIFNNIEDEYGYKHDISSYNFENLDFYETFPLFDTQVLKTRLTFEMQPTIGQINICSTNEICKFKCILYSSSNEPPKKYSVNKLQCIIHCKPALK